MRGRGERCADVERRAGVAVIVDQQNFLGVGTLYGEAAQIVGGETVGGVEFYLAAVEAGGYVERGEFDGGASVCRDRPRFSWPWFCR